jgi:hypothetical protein
MTGHDAGITGHVRPEYPVCHRIVSVTIHAKLPVSSRTLVRQTEGGAAGAARRLKILVSVVRFRPGPPRIPQNANPCRLAFLVSRGDALVPGLFPGQSMIAAPASTSSWATQQFGQQAERPPLGLSSHSACAGSASMPRTARAVARSQRRARPDVLGRAQVPQLHPTQLRPPWDDGRRAAMAPLGSIQFRSACRRLRHPGSTCYTATPTRRPHRSVPTENLRIIKGLRFAALRVPVGTSFAIGSAATLVPETHPHY